MIRTEIGYSESLQYSCKLLTPMADFLQYDTGSDGIRLLTLKDINEQAPWPLVRIHSSCIASEVFGSRDCDCADQLRESMKLIAEEGSGLIFHLDQEGRGHGLRKKILAVGKEQSDNLDTVQAFDQLGMLHDIRDYAQVVDILLDLGLRQIRLITNNPAKLGFLQGKGIEVNKVPTHPVVRAENSNYLETKKLKLGHLFPSESEQIGNADILFYHSDQPYGKFSNFSLHAIHLHGRIWPTVEHYYQAQKFHGKELEEQIRLCATPTRAKQLATDNKSVIRLDWHTEKESVMLEALRAKFGQHPDLKSNLLNTGLRRLVEHTKNDAYWGDGGDSNGRNRLGELLMQVRSELRLEHSSTTSTGNS